MAPWGIDSLTLTMSHAIQRYTQDNTSINKNMGEKTDLSATVTHIYNYKHTLNAMMHPI